jgi:DNA mismatch endonuclease (patch repair protein)
LTISGLDLFSKVKNYKQKAIKVPRFEEAAGFYTTENRSRLMGTIKSRNTKPEILLRKELWKRGYRYRIDVKALPGRPDIVISKYQLVIFVDGEFWHGHRWDEKKQKIKTNRGFWLPKIERNIQRDDEVNERLEELGWTVVRFWEHKITKDLKGSALVVEAIARTPFLKRNNFEPDQDFANFTQ